MLPKITYNRLKIMINRKEIDMYMYYCRNVFDICLRNKGIESEIIGLLDEELVPTPCESYYHLDINKIITMKIRPVLEKVAIKLAN